MPSLAMTRAMERERERRRLRPPTMSPPSQQWLARHAPQEPPQLNIVTPQPAFTPGPLPTAPAEPSFEDELEQKRELARIPYALKEEYGALERGREDEAKAAETAKTIAAYEALGYGPMAKTAAEAGLPLAGLQGEKRIDLGEMKDVRAQGEKADEREALFSYAVGQLSQIMPLQQARAKAADIADAGLGRGAIDAELARMQDEREAEIKRKFEEVSLARKGAAARTVAGKFGYSPEEAETFGQAGLMPPQLPSGPKPPTRTDPVSPEANKLLIQLSRHKTSGNVGAYDELLQKITAEARGQGGWATVAQEALRRLGIRPM